VEDKLIHSYLVRPSTAVLRDLFRIAPDIVSNVLHTVSMIQRLDSLLINHDNIIIYIRLQFIFKIQDYYPC
jgi:hypothetical protein